MKKHYILKTKTGENGVRLKSPVYYQRINKKLYSRDVGTAILDFIPNSYQHCSRIGKLISSDSKEFTTLLKKSLNKLEKKIEKLSTKKQSNKQGKLSRYQLNYKIIEEFLQEGNSNTLQELIKKRKEDFWKYNEESATFNKENFLD